MEEIKNNIEEDDVVTDTTEVVEDDVNEEVVEEAEETLSPSDYKVIISMIREMEDQYEMTEKSVHNAIETNYRLSPDVLEMVLPYEMDKIEELEASEMREFLTNNCKYRDDDTYKSMTKPKLVEVMKFVKDASLVLLNTKKEADALKAESGDVLREYFNYMSSDRVKKSREKRLEAMKKALEFETDPYQIKKIKEMIEAMETSMNFSFLQKRFEKFGDKEIGNIKEGFFEDFKGTYVIDRYKNKIKRFGFNPEVYKYFFNIEENFLSKKYSPFNNLFLFIYMRMVAYSDVNSKVDNLLVHSITGALANLIYHKFNSTESEQYFLQVISEILDRFEDDRDFFIENNKTYEEHPARKEAELEHERKRRSDLIRKMDRLKITGYDPEAPVEELQEYYNKEHEIIINKQLNKDNKDEQDIEVEESDDVESTEEIVEETELVENSEDTIQESVETVNTAVEEETDSVEE